MYPNMTASASCSGTSRGSTPTRRPTRRPGPISGCAKARRTPDLLPRDIVARAIYSEVKAGRGSPHGGVFLDIHSRRSPEDIKRKLPAMYHQFKELGDVDITAEIGR